MLLCFVQLFIVSNHTDTWYFAKNNTRRFSFNADERSLPIYEHARPDNSNITHKDFDPRAQPLGFTSTPIFEDNIMRL